MGGGGGGGSTGACWGRFEAAARAVFNTFSPLSPFPILFSLAGAATGQSNFGKLPAVYPSPSHACLHGLGGLQLLAKPKMDKAGAIIGVCMVFVNCPQCKGAPYLVGKHKGKKLADVDEAGVKILIEKWLPQAKAAKNLEDAGLITALDELAELLTGDDIPY